MIPASMAACSRRRGHSNMRAVRLGSAGFVGAADVTRCRVLEIGCAVGRNIIPMAQTLPNSTFLGIDLSPKQIEIGQHVVRQLNLSNIELRTQDAGEALLGQVRANARKEQSG